MSDTRVGAPDWVPFPAERPAVVIEPLPDEPGPLLLEELPWWFAVPRVGESGAWGTYDAPDWRLTSATSLRAVRPAEVHGEACVEVTFVDGEADCGWSPQRGALYGRLAESCVEYVASAFERDGKLVLRTFLDPGFDSDWGRFRRLVAELAAFDRISVTELRMRSGGGPIGKALLGDGLWRVAVGEREFTCLRLLDLDLSLGTRGTLMEGYIADNGRTILCRRYNGDEWRRPAGDAPDWRPWGERLPSSQRLTVEGVTYILWYDCLSHTACGVSALFGPDS
jgi:hypothetical protein